MKGQKLLLYSVLVQLNQERNGESVEHGSSVNKRSQSPLYCPGISVPTFLESQ
jgi:hypothetical protein